MRFLVVLLLLQFSVALAGRVPIEPIIRLSDLEAQGYSISEPLSIQHIEAEALEEVRADSPRVPQVAFGFTNAEWERFKTKVRPGDVIVRAKSPAKTWRGLAGWRGILLLRDDVVVESFTEAVS